MFRTSLCPSSGTYQLQQQPLVYRRNVVVAVLLGDSFECVKMHGPTNRKHVIFVSLQTKIIQIEIIALCFSNSNL
jgi:hypothetical protein